MKPTVAIAIIVRDAENTIERLLKSILTPVEVVRPEGRDHHIPGPPIADEFIFVDTGSVDRTREIIAEACGLDYPANLSFDPWDPAEGRWRDVPGGLTTRYGGDAMRGKTMKFAFARFDWIKDFSAARNFAFGLATSDWVGYLDADDQVENGHLLRDLIADAAAGNHEAVAFPYDYAPGILDWPIRFIDRRAGINWRRRVHETLDPETPRRLRVKAFSDLVVHHAPRTLAESEAAVARNHEIVHEAYAAAKAAGNDRDAACYAYTIGLEHLAAGDNFGAEEYLLETTRGPDGASFLKAQAAIALSTIELERQNPQRAMEHGADAVLAEPSFPDAHVAFGIALHRCRDHEAAAKAFDHAFLKATFPVRNSFFVNGIGRALAALSYIGVWRLDDADAMLGAIPEEYVKMPKIAGMIERAQKALAKRRD